MPEMSLTLALEQFTTFGDLLKYLRRRAGLTQRDLSIAVGYSISQISRLEQNQRLPDLATLSARFLPVLDVDDQPVAGRRLLELAAAIRLEDAPAPGEPPYKGLLYFDEADAELFFGREVLVEKLFARLMAQAVTIPRFLGVIGASGSGKSSVVRAGLIPAVRRQADWSVVVLTPTAYPLQALAAAQSRWLGSEARPSGPGWRLLAVDQFEELFTLCRSEAEQITFVDRLMAMADEPGGTTSVVIALRADFYAQCARFEGLRAALAQQQAYIGPMTAVELRRAIEEPARRGEWEFEPGLVDALLRDVGAADGRAPEPGALPLLSHALLETWARRRGRTLTLTGYRASGGVRGAIGQTAEALYQDQFDAGQRAVARQIFLRLTELGEEGVTADTRRRAALAELIPTKGDATAVRDVVQALADARLITTGQDSAEVAHEALIREWPTLRGWLEEDRESLRLHRGLTEAAQEWLKLEREIGALYRGARLAQALEWSAGHPGQPNALEQEFLDASRNQAERDAAEREAARQRELEAARQLADAQARSARQLRRRAIYLLAALGVAVVAALAAGVFGQQANRAATLANANLATAQSAQATSLAEQSVAQANFTRAEGQRLAAESLNLANTGGSSELAALLALRAVKLQSSPQTDAALQAAASLDYPLRVFLPNQGEIFVADYSPDGRYIATYTNPRPPVTGTVTIWDVQAGGALHAFPQPNDSRARMAFSPDSQSLLICRDSGTGSQNGLLEVYNVQSGQRTRQFLVVPRASPAFLFWLDDRTVILTDQDNSIHRIDLTTGRETDSWPSVDWWALSRTGRYALGGYANQPATLYDLAADSATGTVVSIDPGTLGAAALSPDQAYAAFGFTDGSIQLWKISTGKIIQMRGHVGAVNVLDFSPDSQYLLSGGADKTARLWQVANGQPVHQWNSNASDVSDIKFSADGRSFVAGSIDGTARLWAIAPQREWPVFNGTQGLMDGVTFSPDSRQIAISGKDATVRLWDVHTGEKVKTFTSNGEVDYGLRFTPDGRHLLAADVNGQVSLWDLATGALAWQNGPGGDVGSYHDAAIAPDGQSFTVGASWSNVPAGTANYGVVFDTRTGKEVWRTAVPYSFPTDAFAADYSPDGNLIAFAMDGDDSLWLFDAHSGRMLRQIQAQDLIWGVRFSPDSRTLVAAGQDKTARLWDVATGQMIRQFVGQTDVIWRAAFSPDGAQLATASHDGTIGVWDVATGELLRRFVSDPLGNEDVDWSPDGRLLASVGDSGVARLWDADYRTTVQYLCGRLQRGLTDAERAQYNISDSSPTCGK